MSDIDEILTFWFEGLNDRKLLDKNAPAVKKWFVKNEHFDREIRQQFEENLLKAVRGEYAPWKNSASGRLALVILFDQFSRNMYRGSPKMFAADGAALAVSLRSIEDGFDGKLQLIERIFLYMPLMHAEDLRVQELALKYFGRLVAESKEKSPKNTAYYEYSFSFARQHHEIIKEFGRFPHRNNILGRVSTPQESEFLKRPGSSF